MSTPHWLARFQSLGFAVRPNLLDSELMSQARARLDRVVAQELAQPQPSPGVARIERGKGRWITGIASIYPALGPLALQFLGHPAVVETARSICGDDAIPTHDWMVIKNRGDGQKVGWHQDFVHHYPHPAINIGIPLDDVREDAVRFLPDLRGGRQPVAQWADTAYDDPGAIPAPVPAGGITLHDVTLVHGSPPLTQQERRATLYIEFRHAESLRDHPSIPPAYIELRRRLFEVAQKGHAAHRLREDFTGEELAILNALSNHPSGIEAANYGTP